MRIKSVFHIIGLIIFFLGLSMLLPLGYAFFGEKNVRFGLFLSFIITSFSGILIFNITRAKEEIRTKDGFAIVTLGWIIISFFGTLPFLFTGSINSLTDAFFETASGFTTTGASIIKDIEILPKSVLLWRSQIQWIGGMGIIVLSLAILPMLGIGGMQIFKAEVPGPTHEKLVPRVRQTAKILWGVYVLFTIVEIALLKIAGMSLFDSVNHTFACMATGGYSTKNSSIGAFNNVWIEIIITFFMFVAGINFATHYHALNGKPLNYFKDKEFLFYSLIFIIATLFLTFDTYLHNYNSLGKSLRNSVFHSVSIGTTTGFVTDDYNKWPYASINFPVFTYSFAIFMSRILCISGLSNSFLIFSKSLTSSVSEYKFRAFSCDFITVCEFPPKFKTDK